jgi:DNA-directed RNA polymerase specialized sigma24 family protein
MEIEEIKKHIDSIIDILYADNATKVQQGCHKSMARFGGISQMDYDDFYSRFGYELCKARDRYARNLVEKNKDFDEKDFYKYLSGIFYHSTCKEMTKRNRKKRMIVVEIEDSDEYGEPIKRKKYVQNISMDMPVNENENITVGDMLFEKNMSIEKILFDDNEEEYSCKMEKYLSKLSKLQKEVLRLMIANYSSEEIMEELGISEGKYRDCINAIHSDKNLELLINK